VGNGVGVGGNVTGVGVGNGVGKTIGVAVGCGVGVGGNVTGVGVGSGVGNTIGVGVGTAVRAAEMRSSICRCNSAWDGPQPATIATRATRIRKTKSFFTEYALQVHPPFCKKVSTGRIVEALQYGGQGHVLVQA
jgi:hypothetical protein